MVSVIGMRTHPRRGANSLDLTSGLGRIYVESSDRQHSGTQGSGTHVLRRVSKSVPTIAGICVGDCQLDLRALENTRTIHTDLSLMRPYKTLRSDPCLADTT